MIGTLARFIQSRELSIRAAIRLTDRSFFFFRIGPHALGWGLTLKLGSWMRHVSLSPFAIHRSRPVFLKGSDA